MSTWWVSARKPCLRRSSAAVGAAQSSVSSTWPQTVQTRWWWWPAWQRTYVGAAVGGERPDRARAPQELDRAVDGREAEPRLRDACPVVELDECEATFAGGDRVEHRLPLRRHAGARRQGEIVRSGRHLPTLTENHYQDKKEVVGDRWQNQVLVRRLVLLLPLVLLAFGSAEAGGPAHNPGATATAWAIRVSPANASSAASPSITSPPAAAPSAGSFTFPSDGSIVRAVVDHRERDDRGHDGRGSERRERRHRPLASSAARSPPTRSPRAPRPGPARRAPAATRTAAGSRTSSSTASRSRRAACRSATGDS